MGVVSSAKQGYNKQCLYSELLKFDKEQLISWFNAYPDYLDKSIAIDCKMTPLCLAASRGNLELMKFLLELGADINGTGEMQNLTPVMWAVF